MTGGKIDIEVIGGGGSGGGENDDFVLVNTLRSMFNY